MNSNQPAGEPGKDTAGQHELAALLASAAKPRRTKARILAVAVSAFIAIALIAYFAGKDDGPQYVTKPVVRGDLRLTVTATGTLQPTNQVDIGSEISGTLKSVKVDFNQQVKKGQLLAEIDTLRLDAQIRQSEAALESAAARVAASRVTVKESAEKTARLLALAINTGGGSPSRQELDSAEATMNRARAELDNSLATVKQARAGLDSQKIDRGRAAILSPITGVVLKRQAEPGQTVAASFQTPVLFSLAEDLTRMELHVDIDEADISKIKVGQKAGFTVASWPGEIFAGQVSQVRLGSKTVAGVVTYETLLAVDNSDLKLRPGMTGTATITVGTVTSALLAPAGALRYQPPVASQEKAGSGFLSKLVPRPPQSKPREKQSAKSAVYILKNGQPLRAEVVAGKSDGILTEVSGGGLVEGSELVMEQAGK